MHIINSKHCRSVFPLYCLFPLQTRKSFLMLIFQNTFLATRSRSRSNILMDQHGDHEGSSQETIPEVQPEEVLVISLGTGPQITPGMMSENEVCKNYHVSDILKCTASVFSNSRTMKM